MLRRIDIIGGAIFVAIALASLYQAADLDTGTLRSFGPGMLPTILAAILLLSGIALLVVGIARKTPEYLQASLRGPGLVGLSILFFALTIEGTELGPLFVPRLGLVIAGPITLILAGYGSTEAAPRDLIGVGCGLTACCLALFNDLLGMDIPVVPTAVDAVLAGVFGNDGALRAAYLLLAVIAGLIATFRPASSTNA